MSEERAIVVYVDERDEPLTLVRRALPIATSLGAPLHLVSVLFDPYIAGERFADTEDFRNLRTLALDQERSNLSALVSQAVGNIATVECISLWGRPKNEALCQYLEETNAQMLVVGTHPAGKIARSLLTYSDWALLRDAPCSVLSVARSRYGVPAVISVAVDPMHTNDKPAILDKQLIATAHRLSGTVDAEVHLVHAVEDINSMVFSSAMGTVPIAVDDRGLQETIDDHHLTALKKLGAESGIAPEHVHQVNGSPVLALQEKFTQLNTDLVVLGVISRRGLREKMVGNTAERLIRRLHTDLLLVKPGDLELKTMPIAAMKHAVDSGHHNHSAVKS